MNEVSIIINGVRYDAVEMTPEENDMAVSCSLCDLQHECENAPTDLAKPCGYILGLSRYFKKSDKKASDWISVEDRLPEFDEYVFIAIEMRDDCDSEIETEIDIGWINEDGDFSMINDWYEGQPHFKITHWQPIVFPTKEELLKSL